MGIIIGTLLTTMGIALFSWSVLEFQRPRPPLWTKRENYAISFSVALTAFFSLGIASFIHGVTQEANAMPGAMGWIVVAASCAAFAVFMIGLTRWWKRVRTESPAADFSADGVLSATPANDPSQAMKTKPQGNHPKAA